MSTMFLNEVSHRHHCYLCHDLELGQRPDLCLWHYALVTARLTWFLLRTGQYGKGRWKA